MFFFFVEVVIIRYEQGRYSKSDNSVLREYLDLRGRKEGRNRHSREPRNEQIPGRYFSSDRRLNEDEIGEACNTNGRNEK